MIYLKNIKNNILKSENIYFFIIIFAIFSLDRYTKNIIIKNLNEDRIFINNFINFDLIWNTGIGFGLLSTNYSIFYNLITIFIGIIILLLFNFLFFSEKIDKLIYCIIIGGALGNFYDRMVFHAVPDFIDLHYQTFHWFTFNIADVFISIGILAFILRSFSIKNKR